MTHLQNALDYLVQLDPASAEYKAVNALITLQIETNVFTYADSYEYERYILPRRKDAEHA